MFSPVFRPVSLLFSDPGLCVLLRREVVRPLGWPVSSVAAGTVSCRIPATGDFSGHRNLAGACESSFFRLFSLGVSILVAALGPSVAEFGVSLASWLFLFVLKGRLLK